jgi:ATP-binding cassette subfamily C (CFTR/MRP) protein 1
MATAVISALEVIGSSWLSFIEHRKSIWPSNILVTYLITGFICGLIFLSLPESVISIYDPKLKYLALWELGIKLVMILIECLSKKSIMLLKYQALQPEVLCGFCTNTFFVWIYSLFDFSNKRIITKNDLPATTSSYKLLN